MEVPLTSFELRYLIDHHSNADVDLDRDNDIDLVRLILNDSFLLM